MMGCRMASRRLTPSTVEEPRELKSKSPRNTRENARSGVLVRTVLQARDVPARAPGELGKRSSRQALRVASSPDPISNGPHADHGNRTFSSKQPENHAPPESHGKHLDLDDAPFDIEPVRTLLERLEWLRKRRALSERALSSLAGLSPSYYAVLKKRLKAGLDVAVGSETMNALAKALNGSVLWLETGDEGIPREPYELFRIKDDPRPNLARVSYAALLTGLVGPEDIATAAERCPDDPTTPVWFALFQLAKQERTGR